MQPPGFPRPGFPGGSPGIRPEFARGAPLQGGPFRHHTPNLRQSQTHIPYNNQTGQMSRHPHPGTPQMMAVQSANPPPSASQGDADFGREGPSQQRAFPSIGEISDSDLPKDLQNLHPSMTDQEITALLSQKDIATSLAEDLLAQFAQSQDKEPSDSTGYQDQAAQQRAENQSDNDLSTLSADLFRLPTEKLSPFSPTDSTVSSGIHSSGTAEKVKEEHGEEKEKREAGKQ